MADLTLVQAGQPSSGERGASEDFASRPRRGLQKPHHIARDRAEGDERELLRSRFPEGGGDLGGAGAADLAIGQTGDIDELYSHYRIDAAAILDAAEQIAPGRPVRRFATGR